MKVSHFGLKEKGSMMGCDCPLCGPGGDVIVPDVMERRDKAKTGMR